MKTVKHATLLDQTLQVGLILFTERYDACVAFYRDTLQLPVIQVQDTLTTFAFGTG